MSEKELKKSKTRQALYDMYLNALSEDKLPWEMRWSGGGPMHNPLTGTNYKGINKTLLSLVTYLEKYDDPRCIKTREFCKKHLDSAIYREKIKERSDETIANIAITLIHQCDVLLRGLIEWKKKEFIKNGGIKEEMFRARKDWQRKNGYYGTNGSNGTSGTNGSNGAH